MPEENKTPEQGGTTEPQNKGGDGFKPIESQADLDRVVGERLSRERAKFSDYDELKVKAEKYDAAEAANLSELEKERKAREAAELKAAAYEAKEQRAQWVADAVKDTEVPADLVRGSTKDEIEAHVASLKDHFTKEPPKRTPIPTGKGRTDEGGSRAVAALRTLRRGA